MSFANAAKFQASGPLHQDLKGRVDAYFQQTGKTRRDQPGMYLKSVLILGWWVASYLFLLLVASGPVTLVLGCVSLALAMAGVGFAVQHDANHGGYSNHKRVNRALAFFLDLVGGSSYVWRWKHNIFHHTHTNVDGLDSDVDIAPFARFAPTQRRRSFHRFQHWYMWLLYGLLGLKWHLVDDFQNVITGRVGGQRMPRPRGWSLVGFLAGKAGFFAWVLVIPSMFHPVLTVVLTYALTAAILGVVIAVIFQLAHCVEGTGFPALPLRGRFEVDWATHQLQTTVDFAPHNRLLTWFLGGLNFQVVHHLFPQVCHLHYPAIAQLVAETCREHGVPYLTQPTFRGALASHFRWLRAMGAKPVSVVEGNPAPVETQPGRALAA